MSQHSTSRDAILVVLHQTNLDAITPFVHSLNRTGYRGQLILFTSQVSQETQNALRSEGVKIIPFHFSGKRDRQPLARLWPLWRWYFATGASLSAKIRLAWKVFHLRYLRYLIYADFLQRHETEFDRILLADGTDIIFQDDPFAWRWSPGLHFFMEEPTKKIDDCRLHRLWLDCQFGPEFAERHAGKNVSCSGTTYGDVTSIRQYLDQMIRTTMSARNLAKISGGDQGIHNYLLIENLLPNITVHHNRHAPVLTMGIMHPASICYDQEGLRVLNDDRQPAPVLHQYNRIPGLKEKLLSRLAGAV